MKENKTHTIKDWPEIALGDALKYEQPYKYAVNDAQYNASSGVPVLTAGKSFILGYTNEMNGVYSNLPVIIFDDFTTDSKYVDFPFKVKSSAMKFLKEKNENEVDLKFMFEVLQSVKLQSTGGDHKRRWISEYSKIKIKAPKFEEQTRIAQILCKADAAITQTEALIAKYQRIKTGLMQDLLTKGIDEHGNIRSKATHKFVVKNGMEVPEEWEVNELRHYISYISYGFTNPMPEAPEGPYLITAANVNEGRVLYESCRRTTEKAFKELLTNKSRPRINDVLITKDGSLGRMAIVDRENLCINQSVAVMRTISDRIDFRFFKMLLESDSYQSTIIGDAGGSTIKHIYITKIDKMLLSVPKEIDEQIRILNIIDTHDRLVLETKNKLSKLQSLKTGLMQDLLSGKVRVKVKENELIKR